MTPNAAGHRPTLDLAAITPMVIEAEALQLGTRERNVLAVLDALVEGGTSSRPDIARRTGLSKPTVGSILSSLEDFRLAKPIGVGSASRGPKASLYTVAATELLVLGIAIGSSTIRTTMMDVRGGVERELDVPLESPDLSSLLSAIDRIGAEASRAGGVIRLVVAGVPGIVDSRTGIVRTAPNIAGLEGRALAQLISDRLGIPAVVENDVNCAAVAERRFGQAEESSNFGYLHIGAGVGAGLIIEGRLLRGVHGAAGEVGFMATGADPFAGEASTVGPLEGRIGSAGILRRAREGWRADGRAESDVPQRAVDVFHAATRGDAVAREVVDFISKEAAVAIASIVAVTGVERVYLGGSVGRALVPWLSSVRGYVSRLLPWPPTVVASSLGSRAVPAGAAALALDLAVPLVVRALVAATDEGDR